VVEDARPWVKKKKGGLFARSTLSEGDRQEVSTQLHLKGLLGKALEEFSTFLQRGRTSTRGCQREREARVEGNVENFSYGLNHG